MMLKTNPHFKLHYLLACIIFCFCMMASCLEASAETGWFDCWLLLPASLLVVCCIVTSAKCYIKNVFSFPISSYLESARSRMCDNSEGFRRCTYPTCSDPDCEFNYLIYVMKNYFPEVFAEYPDIPDLRIEVGDFGDGTRWSPDMLHMIHLCNSVLTVRWIVVVFFFFWFPS